MDSRSGTARSSLLVGVLAALVAAGTLVQAVGGPAPAPAPGSEPATPAASEVGQTLSSLPLSFIENQGQVDPRVAYYVHGSTTSVYFTSEGVTFSLPGESSPPQATPEIGPGGTLPAGWARQALEGAATERYTLKLDFVGADPDVRPIARNRASGVVSYFTGPKEEWHTGLPTFKQIVYPELWPGIDLVYEGTGSELKYTFHVDPGADPSQIRLAYRGASGIELNSEGELEVSTPATVLTEKAPYTYQSIDGKLAQVASGYVLASTGSEYGFALGGYDPTRTLVIDPVVVVYAGYIGGSRKDVGIGAAADTSGNAYVTGYTGSSQDFPVLVGPDLTDNGGGTDAFVAKVAPSGNSLVYAGYIGGRGEDYGYSVAVDGEGSAYVAGNTNSGEDRFPVVVGPDPTFNGFIDAFVAKVEPSGESLTYAGYIGGAGLDVGRGVMLDSAGSAFVTGYTNSGEDSFPVAVGPDLTFNGGTSDAFVARVEPSGESLVYMGYIGGTGGDGGNGIAVDGTGSAYVTGSTSSTEDSFPVAVGPDLSHNGFGSDAFVAKVAPSGKSLAFAGYIGGIGHDLGVRLAVDGARSASVVGYTHSDEASFPVAVGPDLTFNGGSTDAFVAKVEPSGESLTYAGYIGGAGNDFGLGLAVDSARSAYVAGYTDSDETSFPVMVGPDLTYNGGTDAFVAKVEPSGDSLAYAGYIGGGGDDYGQGVAVDAAGSTYVTGYTTSREDSFPLMVGPDLTFNGNAEAFVAKISSDVGPPPCTITGTPQADDLSGTSGDDVICALGGNDTVQARGGDDHVFGQGGADTLAGGGGADSLNGEAGPDILRTTDGIGGNDYANGGAGDDTCIIDEGDATEKCEAVEVR